LLKKLVAEDIPVSEFMREEAKLETFFMDITASNKERIIIENDLSAYREVIDFMLKNNCKAEQESIKALEILSNK